MIDQKQTTTDKAKDIIKAHYGACILSSLESPLDGCHIFPCGEYPSLKKYPAAIVPLTRYYHYYLDNSKSRTRKPKERIEYLMTHCMPDYKVRFIQQLDILFELCKEKNIAMGHYEF